MSFMRSRVAPVVAKPPPGRYEAPLTIHLHCDTPGAQIIFTLDGSIPVGNSDREHGFRCEHYKPLSGYTLKGGGRHILTVVATKKGFVGTEVQQFQYVLSGDVVERRVPNLRDIIIERRFNAMVDLDPSMPLRLARARSPELMCALVDTCPRAILKEKAKEGKDLALFELTHSTRVVSRSDKYRRIVAPSMTLSIPVGPPRKPGVAADAEDAPPLSLRSSSSQTLAPIVYEHSMHITAAPTPTAVGSGDNSSSLHLASGGGADGSDEQHHPVIAGSETRVGSAIVAVRASAEARLSRESQRSLLQGVKSAGGAVRRATTPLSIASGSKQSSAAGGGGALVVSNNHNNTSLSRPHTVHSMRSGTPSTISPRRLHTTVGHPRLSPTPTLLRRAPTPSAAPAAMRTQLAVFEQRAQLMPKFDHYYNDAEEQQEDEQYVVNCKDTIKREVDRLAPISEQFGKKLVAPMRHPLNQDVAGGDSETLKLLLRAKDICHTNLRRILSIVPYSTLQQKFAKVGHFVAADLEALTAGIVNSQEITIALRSVLMPPAEAGFFDPRQFLLLCRFVIWTARPIPEAVFGLVFAQWKMDAVALGLEPQIGKVAIMSVLETYRRTRGANQEAIGQLYTGYHSGIPFNDDGSVSSGMFQHYVSTHVPIVDAAVMTMNDLADPMYHEPLHLWDHPRM